MATELWVALGVLFLIECWGVYKLWHATGSDPIDEPKRPKTGHYHSHD